MNTEHEFCFTIKLKQNNSRDLKNVLHAQETFCRYFRHTKRTDKKTTATKKTYQNKKQKIPNNKNKIQKDQNQKSNETTKY